MNHFFSRPLFWIIFTITALSCLFLSHRYFSRAFPLITLDLTMDRTQALQHAEALAKKYQTGPVTYAQAASFETDHAVKNYVELEAGDTKAFATMLIGDYYAPYTWHVRHFNEFEKQEVTFIFKPDGTPYGFKETVSEDTPGSALTHDQALAIAAQSAVNWNVNFAHYSLANDSKKIQPSGRIDHTFVYERVHERIGQGTYRLTVVISGDKITELTHSVKIPESFLLRYKEMRSANNSIASAASMVMVLLYLLGGCVIGLYFLLLRRLVLWRTPIMWGTFVACLQTLTTFNQLPLFWMHYDSAISMQGFLLSLVIKALFQFIFFSCFYSLVFATAESFSRAAFGNHIQLWRSWSLRTASSTALLGRTLGGYFMVALYLLFVVAFYLIATQQFGWWTPSESLIDPNILATYAPWLSSIALSLGAGFMEESLFRAVPIAGSALLGERFGNKRAWIITGFIVQALIFGAAHANYPAQPAYARIVELLFFSIVNGLIYLGFGLIPAIIAHFTYDVVWFSLPLFVSTAPYAWINQLLVIILTLIPLWVVLFARLQQGSWHTLNTADLNNAWHPEPMSTANTQRSHERSPRLTPRMPTRNSRIIIIAGIIGLCAWVFTTQFKQDGNTLPVNRSQAIATGNEELKKRSIIVPKTWQPVATVAAEYTCQEDELQHLFIWQKGGKQLYHQMLGTYLKPARWTMRYVTFSPTIATADRAEEYQMAVTHNGTVHHFIHQLPEDRNGIELSEQEARTLAHNTLLREYQLKADDLQEISVHSEKKPNRKDWIFIFSNSADMPLPDAQARITIEINGNEVVDSYRSIHVPESWEREKLNTKNRDKIIQFLCTLLLFALLCFGALIMFKQGFATTSSFIVKYFIALFILFCLSALNAWHSVVATFNTSAPFSHQLFTSIFGSLVGSIVNAGVWTLLLTGMQNILFKHPMQPRHSPILGVACGLFFAGFYSLLTLAMPQNTPVWAHYSAQGTYFPTFAIIHSAFIAFLTMLVCLICIFLIIDTITKQWQCHTVAGTCVALLSGIILTGLKPNEPLLIWLALGIGLGACFVASYRILVRYDFDAIPIAACTFFATQLIQQAAFNAFPGALLANCFAALILAALTWWWYK